MAEDPEKRFERAMSLLFSSKSSPSGSAPAASIAGASSSTRGGDAGPIPGFGKKALANATTPTSRPRSMAVISSPVGGDSSKPLCRPWDRGDLLKRLATFKSITWFGKPQVAGPVACARRGWINVDVDLLACEGCGVRLSFVIPPSWSRTQVDSAAETFGEQLDSGHKTRCAWKGNACSEDLAFFPPTPLSAIVEGFNDRCERLLQLSAVPVISTSAIDTLKLFQGRQIDSLLAQSPPLVPGLAHDNEHFTRAESGDRSENGFSYNGFYQAQRLIALCGWEPRLLPYTVDYEKDSASPAKHSQSRGPSDAVVSRKSLDPGLNVFLVSRGGENGEVQLETLDNKGTKSDPAAAVLECSLCGASVGLWSFSTISRPPAPLGLASTDPPDTAKGFVSAPLHDASGASIVDGGSGQGREKESAELREEAGDATKTPPCVRSSTAGVLNLSLTIAGGPPPTQLSSLAVRPPAFSPVPAFQPRSSKQLVSSEVGDWVASYDSGVPRHDDNGAQVCGSTVDTSNLRPIPGDSAEGTVVDHDMDDGKGSASFKRRRTESSEFEQSSQAATLTSGNAVSNREATAEVHGAHRERRQRTEAYAPAAGASTHFGRRGLQELPRSSSVNAIDTNYLQKQENSMGCAESLCEDSDGHGTTVSTEKNQSIDQMEGTETVANATHGEGIGATRGDETETNVAGIRTGPGTEGGASVGMEGGSVGMEGSHGTEIRDAVSGVNFSVQGTDGASVDAEVIKNQGLRGEFGRDQGSMDESLPDGETGPCEVHGDSDEVMLHPDKQFSKKSDAPQVESAERREKRSEGNDQAEDEGTVDTTKAVILCDDQAEDEGTVDTSKAVILCGDSSQDAVATDVHTMAAVGAEEDHGCTTVNGPGRALEELRIWDTNIGEFDPIQRHRYFCPWVNGRVAATSNSSSVPICGWQLTLDALHTHYQQGGNPSRSVELESTTSMYKTSVLVSVCRLMGTSASKRPNGSRIPT